MGLDVAVVPAGPATGRVAVPLRRRGWPPALRRVRRELLPLFPSSAQTQTSARARGWAVAGYGAGWLLLTALLLARVAPPGATHTIWAEDGAIFSREAIVDGPSALLGDYAGYLQILPRLLAAVAVRDPEHLAGRLAVLSATTAAGLALAVFATSRAHLPSRAVRSALALSVVLLPVTRVEVLANAANVQWYALFCCWWLLLFRPSTRLGHVALAGLVLLLVTSAPLTLLLWPLAAARLLALARREQAVVLAMAVGTALQLLVVAQGTRPPSTVRPGAGDLASSWLVRACLGLLGVTPASGAVRTLGWAAVALATLVVLGCAVVAARDAGRARLAVVALLSSALLLSGALGFQWTPGLRPTREDLHLLVGGRYSVAPVLLVVVIVAAAAQTLLSRRARARPAERRGEPGRARLVSGALALPVVAALVALVVGFVADFRVPGARSTGYTWDQSLGRASAVCARYPALVEIDLPITPSGWTFDLPCDYFRASGRDHRG